MYSDVEIGALADGFLDGHEAAAIRAHLESCPECASLYRDLQRIHAALSGDYCDVPDTLVPGVMYKIGLHSKGRRRLSFGWFTAAAAVLAVILLANPIQDLLGLRYGEDAAPAPQAASVERTAIGITDNEWMAPAMFDANLANEGGQTFTSAGEALPPGGIPFSEIIEIHFEHAPEWLPEIADDILYDLEHRVIQYFILSARMEQVLDDLNYHETPYRMRTFGLDDSAVYGLVIVGP
jgi:hypothetical protein